MSFPGYQNLVLISEMFLISLWARRYYRRHLRHIPPEEQVETEKHNMATTISASLARDGSLPMMSQTMTARSGPLMVWPTSAKEILEHDMYEDALTRLNAGSHANRFSGPPFSGSEGKNVDSKKKRSTVNGSVPVSKVHNNPLALYDKYLYHRHVDDVTYELAEDDGTRSYTSQNDLTSDFPNDLIKEPRHSAIKAENVKLEFLDPGFARD